MRISALLVQKKLDFSKFMVCPHGQGGIEPVRTRGEGVSFSRFSTNVLYRRSLTKLRLSIKDVRRQEEGS